MTATCARCGRPIEKKHYSCRPCSVAAVRGTPAYAGPCATPTREPTFHLNNRTCAECGYPLPDHEYADG